MKKILAILFVALFFVLCGCGLSPNKESEHDDFSAVEFKLYVCGAVEKEGYVVVRQGADVNAAIALAGIAQKASLPTSGSCLVECDGVIVVDFFDEQGNVCSPTNCNGLAVKNKLPCDGIPQNAVNAVADYIAAHGKIKNRAELKLALGDLFADNFYKFFVEEADYEAD